MGRPLERLKRSITTENLWMYVLRVLESGPSHPYAINQTIEKRFGFRPGNVTIYILLKRLELDGYVRKSAATQSGGPERSNYAITAKGAKELKGAVPMLRKIAAGLSG